MTTRHNEDNQPETEGEKWLYPPHLFLECKTDTETRLLRALRSAYLNLQAITLCPKGEEAQEVAKGGLSAIRYVMEEGST